MTSPRDLARQVLSRPDEFPPEFVSWLTRLISNNPRIGGLSGGGSSTTAAVLRNLAASWSGVLLSVVGLGPTERVPELTGGTGTWTLTKAYFRCETAGSGTTTVVIEKMTPDADASWATATTVATLTLAAGHYETSATISVPVTTGDLLRIRFTSIGTTGLFAVSTSGTATGGGGTALVTPVAVSLQVTDPNGAVLTTGNGQAYFRVPSILNGLSLLSVAAHVTTVSSSGLPTVQIHNDTQGADMLTTKITIDASEVDSSTAATPAVIDAAHKVVATADELRIDVPVAGTNAKGLIVEMQFG